MLCTQMVPFSKMNSITKQNATSVLPGLFCPKYFLHKVKAIKPSFPVTKASPQAFQKQKLLVLGFTKSRHLPFLCTALKRTPCVPQVNLVPFVSRVCIGCFYCPHLSLLRRIPPVSTHLSSAKGNAAGRMTSLRFKKIRSETG